jgi:hypothetical protein
VPNSCPIRRRTPVNQSQPQLTFRRTQGKPPWSQDPPDTSSKLVIRQTLLGRSTSQLRETGHGGGLVSVFVSVAFVRLRSPTLRSDPVMRAGREHARTTGKPGWKACWTDSNRDSNVAEKGPVGGEPVGTARAVNGLSWTVGQARPGPTEQMRALFGCGLHPLAELRQQQLEGPDLTIRDFWSDGPRRSFGCQWSPTFSCVCCRALKPNGPSGRLGHAEVPHPPRLDQVLDGSPPFLRSLV